MTTCTPEEASARVVGSSGAVVAVEVDDEVVTVVVVGTASALAAGAAVGGELTDDVQAEAISPPTATAAAHRIP